MRLIPTSNDRQVWETDTPGEYVVLGVTTAKLPDSRAPIPVQDMEHPLCTVDFSKVSVEDLQAIIKDRQEHS